jgi:WD40 repeat protein
MRSRSIHELLRDYQEALGRRQDLSKDLAERLVDYERFVRTRGHILQHDPTQVFAQGAAQPEDSAVGREFRRLADEGRGPKCPWFRLRNVPAADSQPELLLTIEVEARIETVAWLTVEGKPHAMAGCWDGNRLYDLATGQLVKQVLPEPSDRRDTDRGFLNQIIAVSPEGRHALFRCSEDGTLGWWDLKAGHYLSILENKPGIISLGYPGAVALSADSRRALLGWKDGTLRWWDLGSGDCLRTLKAHTQAVYAVALSPDGRHALSGSKDGTVRWWDSGSGDCLRTLMAHTQAVLAVALLSHGHQALSGSKDGTLRWWDLGSGDCLRTLKAHTQAVYAVALSPDGRHALSGSEDGTVRWWDLVSGCCLNTLKSRWTAVALSADGRHALAGGGKTLRCWDLGAGRCLDTQHGHTGRVTAVEFSSDNCRALSASSDGMLRLWDPDAGRCLRVLEGHAGEVTRLALSSDKRCALSGSADGTLRYWNLEAGCCLKTLKGHTESVNAVALSPDGRRALSQSGDGTLCSWDLEAGHCLKTLKGQADGVAAAALSSDGRHALLASADGTLQWRDLAASHCLSTLKGQADGVTAMALSSDNRRALSWSFDGTLCCWDLEAGHWLHKLECSDRNCVALSADCGRALLEFEAGSLGVTMWSWVDVKSGRGLGIVKRYEDDVDRLTLSSDGRRALSAIRRTLRFWNVESGRCLATFACDFPVKVLALTKRRPYRAFAGDSEGGVYFFDIVEPGEA